MLTHIVFMLKLPAESLLPHWSREQHDNGVDSITQSQYTSSQSEGAKD